LATTLQAHDSTLMYYSAGIPQLSLPMWFDCYNLAGLAQYVGVGIWGGEETAPHWHTQALKRDFMRALVGDESVALRKRAAELGEKARAYGGRRKAADFVATVAGLGE
jgi:UDP:flavonoid glycosyltransferase YjiC (YdhE family)